MCTHTYILRHTEPGKQRRIRVNQASVQCTVRWSGASLLRATFVWAMSMCVCVSMPCHCVIPLPEINGIIQKNQKQREGGENANALCFISALFLFHWGARALLSACLYMSCISEKCGWLNSKRKAKRQWMQFTTGTVHMELFKEPLVDVEAVGKVVCRPNYSTNSCPLSCIKLTLSLGTQCLITVEAHLWGRILCS